MSDEKISIHAPPRGATPKQLVQIIVIIFQFTPLREGRRLTLPLRPGRRYFNSRPSARGDFRAEVTADSGHRISIHAPPRGATQEESASFSIDNISIHAPPRGATRDGIMLADQVVFQFTPLREGRLFTACVGDTGILFQFTPLREGRRGAFRHDDWSERFQFTPLREGRQDVERVLQEAKYFNSRPSARGDA